MKNNFIELTKPDNTKIIVNLVNITWVEPTKDGSIIFLNFTGLNNFPLSLDVKEEYADIKTYIGF